MISEKEDQIIHMIYDAVLNQQWKRVLSHIATDMNADFGLISFLDQLKPSASFTFCYNSSKSIAKAMDSMEVKLLNKQAHGDLMQFHGIGNATLIDWLPYSSYAEDSPEKRLYDLTIKPSGIRFGNVITLEYEPYCCGFAGIYRKTNCPPFTKQDCSKLENFGLHLRRALQIYRQLTLIKKQAQDCYALLNHLNIAVIVVNSQYQLIYSNHIAQEILQSSHILGLDTNNRLKTSKRQQNELNQMIRSVFKGPSIQHIGGTMMLYKQPDEPLLQLSITPFIQNHTLNYLNSLSDQAVIFITKAKQLYQLSTDYLIKTYNLSLREIQVCELFINGFNLDEICEQLKITKNTLHTYFRNIYIKTSLNSQAELLYLLIKTSIHFEHIPSKIQNE
ncbi:hypothetical protein C3F34_11630 [Acinetobacter sp. ACNIH2]|jgi:DNA-binding NarL/FixJ family response regulator|uniref:helix-turn-helix transcriptional regulator n=1 Tax=Acinetobacter sp. ACNIH2 TaxID=1758189 RepID=UPI000CDCABA0|nr:LuxR C-terminal-related transcriptional regulator [Acinetobacter sp. ACNIH2]AUX86624.1 hypothetical protein C3F34_11630 [Acinetobacter sp. ACNIH2]